MHDLCVSTEYPHAIDAVQSLPGWITVKHAIAFYIMYFQTLVTDFKSIRVVTQTWVPVDVMHCAFMDDARTKSASCQAMLLGGR